MEKEIFINEELESIQKTVRLFMKFLRASADGIVITDEDQNIILVNKIFCELIGKKWHPALQQNLFIWFEETDPNALHGWAELEKRIRKENFCADVEFSVKTPEGIKYFIVNASLLDPVSDEEKRLISSVWRDVTGRENQRNLSRRNIKLGKVKIELGRISQEDSLTGLYNRNYIIDQLGNEILRSRRYGSELSILVLDIDNFKSINEKHSSVVGDEVLVRCGDMIKAAMRDPDISGRMGNDNFLIVLPETDIEGARGFSERLREEFSSIKHIDENGKTFLITCCIGYATIRGFEGFVDDFIKLARKSLLAAKKEGGNRVGYIADKKTD